MSKYDREIVGKGGESADIDVYDVLEAFDVKCPALQHLIKKALCAGLRGHKDKEADLNDIASSAQRAIQLNATRGDAENDDIPEIFTGTLDALDKLTVRPDADT